MSTPTEAGTAESGEQARLERSALIVATVTSFIGPFMLSAVNIALPAMEQGLQLDAVQLSWIATAYLLATAVALVPAGKLADIYGRKRVFALGLLIYTLGCLAGACASSFLVLMVGRLVQGLGAALFVSTGMAIISSIFPPQRRGRAIGIYVAAVYIGLSVGPFVGGLLVQHLGWHSIFWLMVPLGLGSLLLTLQQLKGEWYGDPGQRFDLWSGLLYAAAMVMVVYGATRIPSLPGWALFSAGSLLFYGFLRRQFLVSFPLFELRLFTTNRAFAFSSLAALLNYGATFAVTFLLSLYLQYLKGMSPQGAGTVLMVQPIMMALLSPMAGRLSDRIEPRLLASAGMVVTVIGVFLLTLIGSQTPVGLIIADLALLGIGFALFSSPNMSAIMGAVEPRYYGLASGAVATMRLLGQMFSMTLATLVLSIMVGQQAITPGIYGPFLESIHLVYTLSALFCCLGVYFSWFRGAIHESPSKIAAQD
ncbi:MFS transporter [Desulfogranum mediterraneum]|uniref:MFS transporter n=1 Tax=Desulfogranum mediterraneum TaxID=160661 RepID=UPI000554EFC9|nr:MFS transporter [Desulfogranum mediterraneum]